MMIAPCARMVLLCALVVSPWVLAATPMVSAHNGTTHNADIRAGSCGDDLVTTEGMALEPFVSEKAPAQYGESETSETVITFPAANLLKANLSVVVTGAEGDSDIIIACGAIAAERLLATQGLPGLRFRLDEVGGSGHDGMARIEKEGQDQVFVGLTLWSSSGNTTVQDDSTCELVELYPGYPGYRGYVTGLDGIGDHTCLSDLEAADSSFSRAREDRENAAAGRRLGLTGPLDTWTWENWLVVESERGMTPTCYACAIANADQRPEPANTPVERDDPRLLLGAFIRSTVYDRHLRENNMSRFGTAWDDYQLRAIIGLANSGDHLDATQLLDAYDGFLDDLYAPGRFLDTHALCTSLVAQGGYFPIPSNAAVEDQIFAMYVGYYVLQPSVPPEFYGAVMSQLERLARSWQNEGGRDTFAEYLRTAGMANWC